MKKILAYIVFAISTFAMCWCGLIAISMPYGAQGRMGYALGAGVLFLIALITIGYINSVLCRKDK